MILMNTLMKVMIAVMTIKVYMRFMKLTTGTSESGFLKFEK